MAKMILNTDGRGLWSNEKREVTVTKIVLDKFFDYEDYKFGDLKVYFDPKTWNVNKHGLIYTDERFIRELRKLLAKRGLPVKTVDYTEQGMQGDRYVSCGFYDAKFLKAWAKLASVDFPKKLKALSEDEADKLIKKISKFAIT
jgi:hypothetical protein